MALHPVSSDEFLENLRQSGLLKKRQLEAVLDRLPESSRGRVLARALVRIGALTKFQAEMLLIGRTSGFVIGQYRILDQIGRGGMGRVFKAMHRSMKRTVAVKVLAPHLMKTPKVRKLFRREVIAAAQLQHPNIVAAYDANRQDQRHYLVMEYVDGPSLDDLVRKRGPLPWQVVCEIVRQAAVGLQYAHDMDMVHCDIKPANLLVTRTGKEKQRLLVKILDFGLARLKGLDDEKKPGTIEDKDKRVMGTPDFLSPEQARSLQGLDGRSDLYSLGCTMFALLTASVPYPGGVAMDKLVRHNSEPLPKLDLFRNDVPSEVEAILRRLTAKNPANRFQTAAEVAEALADYASADGSLLDEPPRPDHETQPLTSDTDTPNDFSAVSKADESVEATFPPDLAVTPVLDGLTSTEPPKPLPWLWFAAIGVFAGFAGLAWFFLS